MEDPFEIIFGFIVIACIFGFILTMANGGF